MKFVKKQEIVSDNNLEKEEEAVIKELTWDKHILKCELI